MAPQDPEVAQWFDADVRPYEAGLRAWLSARYPSLTDIDDLLHESYAKLLRARAAGRISNTRAFLFATARNAAIDLFRRRQAAPMEMLAGEHALEEDQPDAAELASRAQEITLLHEAIEALPQRCRQVMVLQKLHHLSNREIAERLGISINTVNAQLVVGLMRCRRYLRDRGVFRGKM